MLFTLTIIRLISKTTQFASTEVNKVFFRPEEIEEILSIDYLATEEQIEEFYDLKAGESISLQIENEDNFYICYISRAK